MPSRDLAFLDGGGEMVRHVRAYDWASSPLGPPGQWPDIVKTTVALILDSHFPQATVWGPERITIYNDRFMNILRTGSAALGAPFESICHGVWQDILPLCEAAYRGESSFIENFPVEVDRGNGKERAFFTLSYSPIRNADGTVAGMLATVMETTESVGAVGRRRQLALLYELGQTTREATGSDAILEATTRMVADHLDVTRCAYADMDPDQDGINIRGDWTIEGAASIVGRRRLTAFGPLTAETLRAGKPLVIRDVQAELPARDAAAYAAIGSASTIGIPLIKEGRLTAIMAVHDAVPHDWTDYDIGVIRSVAERCWAHIERVRSEAHLRRAQAVGGIGMFSLDIPRNMIDGTPEFYHIYGLEHHHEMHAGEIETLVLKEDMPLISTRENRQTGESRLNTEYRIRRADTGEIRWIERRGEFERDDRGKPIRMLGIVRDVTEDYLVRHALKESEAQFRTLAQAMPNMVWTASQGRVDWINAWASEFMGVEPENIRAQHLTMTLHPEDRTSVETQWQAAMAAGEAFDIQYRMRRHDGAFRWHLGKLAPILAVDGTITRWVGTSVDIQDQKDAEEEHARDRNRMWVMSQDMLLVCDMAGVITDVNPSATRLLGWDAEQMIGSNVTDYIHPADLSASTEELSRLGKGIATRSFENRLRTRDGRFLLLDWTAVPDGDRIHAVGRDITESRSIARDQERIWTLSPVLKIVVLAHGGLSKVNPAWVETLGWSADDVAGQRLSMFMVEGDREHAQEVGRSLARGGPLSEVEFSFVARDGGVHRIAWNFVREGGLIYGFGRDVTEQRAVEEALRQSQKMEAVGQLTGGIAHDFNNLLQGVSGNLELLKRRLDQKRTDGVDRFIKGAATSANRAAALTHRLLAFSRRQPLDPRPVRSDPLISSMADMLRRTLGETVTLNIRFEGGLWLTRCDPNQLESAILNLAINARDAMPQGGALTIETGNVTIDAAEAQRLREIGPGDYVRIAVTDTGTGMDADTLSRAFEPFFTTKPIGQGTGLGLSMIYGFARQSEGHAKIDSVVGGGTRVEIYLPRFEGEAGEEEDVPELSGRHATGVGETVLVVEDEPAVRSLIVEVLGDLGYRAIEAPNGLEGLEILRSDQRIDLLVTDIGLPGLNGREVADAGRALRRGLKVLFMTGYAENAALASGFLEPGMAMLTKPFTMEALASRIRDMIET